MVKRALGFLIITMACGVFLINKFYIPATAPAEPAAVHVDTTTTEKVAPKEPKIVYGMIVQDDHKIIEDRIKRNERLGDILEQYNVPAKLIHQLSSLSRKVFDPRKIAADKKYTLIVKEDSVMQATALVYEPNAIDYIIFRFDDSLSVDVRQREVLTVEKTVSGVIHTNLSETIEELGITHELTNKF
ncbi:MAG TPA: peptidase M23, partial [Chryseosolibacter sp.]|nr:peptidase M23 [Chryseosolibacter sp.]